MHLLYCWLGSYVAIFTMLLAGAYPEIFLTTSQVTPSLKVGGIGKRVCLA